MPTILIHFDERGRITQEALRETDFILNRTGRIDIARCESFVARWFKTAKEAHQIANRAESVAKRNPTINYAFNS